jgi:hypothetical protein
MSEKCQERKSNFLFDHCGRGRIGIKARVDDALSLMGSNQLFPRAQLPVNVGESRFEDITDRLPRAAVELN